MTEIAPALSDPDVTRMTPRIPQAWCPSCREWTVIDAGRPCAWCDTILVRGRQGNVGPKSRITESMARAIHVKYEQGCSARKLGQELWQVLAYGSPHSCEFAIGKAFHYYGLPVRERIEATVLASTKSGLHVRDGHERRRKRKEAGLVGSGLRAMQPLQPLCEGIKANAPGKGKRCTRPAVVGSAYCLQHDPERKDERDALMARMRERAAA